MLKTFLLVLVAVIVGGAGHVMLAKGVKPVGDLTEARRALAAWRGGAVRELTSQDVARLAIERGLVGDLRKRSPGAEPAFGAPRRELRFAPGERVPCRPDRRDRGDHRRTSRDTVDGDRVVGEQGRGRDRDCT